MFNRVYYSPARSPCSRAALRTIAAALCASGCGWRSAATPKGPSSAVRAAVLRAFVTEVFAPSLLLPASRQSGRLPPRGNSTAYVLPCGMPADGSRNRLHGGTATAKNYVTFYVTKATNVTNYVTFYVTKATNVTNYVTFYVTKATNVTNHVTFYTKAPPSAINLHVNCIYPYKSQTARTSNK